MTYRRRKGKYTEDLEFEDIKLEDTDSDMDPTRIHCDRGKGIGEEEDMLAFHSLVSALNDLSKGQKDVLHAINMLALYPKPGQINLLISPGDRGSTSSNGKHAYTNMQNTPHINHKLSKPTMPHFLENAVARPVMLAEPSEPFGAYLQEYMNLGD